MTANFPNPDRRDRAFQVGSEKACDPDCDCIRVRIPGPVLNAEGKRIGWMEWAWTAVRCGMNQAQSTERGKR